MKDETATLRTQNKSVRSVFSPHHKMAQASLLWHVVVLPILNQPVKYPSIPVTSRLLVKIILKIADE